MNFCYLCQLHFHQRVKDGDQEARLKATEAKAHVIGERALLCSFQADALQLRRMGMELGTYRNLSIWLA